MNEKTWIVDIGIATKGNVNRALSLSEELEQELDSFGLSSTASGCGFGFRDIQFEAPNEEAAKTAVQVAKKFLKNHFEDEDDYYASCYAEGNYEKEE